MATISKKVCDRCGNPIKYVGWTGILKNVFRRGKTIKIVQLYYGNSTGYNYVDNSFELCADCTEKLNKFLENKL